MIPLSQLWLPAIVCAVLIFIASSLIHMVLKWHNAEYRPFADEEAVRSAMRGTNAGQYVVPYIGDMKRMKEPEIQRKFQEGPVAFITVRRHGSFNMGPSLAMWFVYTLAVSLLAGYVASRSLAAGANTIHVVRITSLLPLLAYIGGSIQQGIWMGKPWSSVAKEVLDGAIYAGITAAAFAWLWPG